MTQAPTIDAKIEAAYPGINVRGVARMLTAYHRALGKRLCANLGLSSEATAAALDGLAWLHPRGVRASWTPRAITPETRGLLLEDLANGKSAPPLIEHWNAEVPQDWCLEGVQTLETATAVANNPPDLSLSRTPRATLADHVDTALTKLHEIWPEAAEELDLMIHALVHVEGGEFKSAAFQHVFGAIYLGSNELSSLPAAIEALVHESGHHSLYLRSAYQPFVTNPADMASHPLRKDPRPVEGTLHAAYVLERMATVFSNWWHTDGQASEEVLTRRNDAIDSLTATIRVLEDKAKWTDTGASYFQYLCDRQSQLSTVSS